MNHEQWEALKAETQGHTPGPWLNEMTFHHMAKRTDATLAAAAPDLLAEVERLRGWLEYAMSHGVVAHSQIYGALNGAEVPK